MAEVTGHLLLVDSSGFAYRAWATSSPLHRESDGEPIGATLRYMEMLWKMLGAARHDQHTHAVAVFDPKGPNFRHKLFPAYKANRDGARSLILDGQMPFMRHTAETLGLHPMEAEGFEADDLIATLAHRAQKAGMRTTIVSSDKDFSQLVADGSVEIVDPMNGGKRVTAADVEKKFGVAPRLVTHVQALAGDSVDNIPGVKGVGMKRAGELIRRWGSLEKVLENAGKVQPVSLRRALKAEADIARLSLKLATLRKNVPLPVDDFSALVVQPVMKSHLVAILKALEATQHMGAVFGMDLQTVHTTEKVADEFAWWKEELARKGQRLPEAPQSGFYKRTLVKGGAFVAARIWREPQKDPFTGQPTGKFLLMCEVGGKPRDPFAEWVRLSMNPIPRKEYSFEIDDADHAKKWRPDDPKADPTKAIDLRSQPVSSNPRRKKA